MQSVSRDYMEIVICYNITYEEQYLPFLLGIGVRVLSTDPRYMTRIQQAIFEINLAEAQSIADKILAQSKISDLTQILNLNSANNVALQNNYQQ